MEQRKPLLDWVGRPLFFFVFFVVEIVDVLALKKKKKNSSRPAPVYTISTLCAPQTRREGKHACAFRFIHRSVGLIQSLFFLVVNASLFSLSCTTTRERERERERRGDKNAQVHFFSSMASPWGSNPASNPTPTHRNPTARKEKWKRGGTRQRNRKPVGEFACSLGTINPWIGPPACKT